MSLKVLTMGGGGASASIFITGLDENSTVTATKGGKTVSGRWAQKPNPDYIALPDGYTQLEYIESTGTQYINTGYIANANTTIEFDASTESNIEAGARIGAQNNAFFLSVQYTNKCARFHFANNAYAEFAIADANNRHTYAIKGNGTCYFDGVLQKTLSGSFSNNLPVYIFCINNGGVKGSGAGKIYRAKITEGETLVRDYFPAKRESDGTLGLFDIANDAFYTNAGTGEFVAGAEIPSSVDGHVVTVKSYGTWTVTATNGEETKTQDVLVDAAAEYEIAMHYKLWLYREGDECEEVTGGWSERSFHQSHSSFSIIKNSDNLQINIAAVSTSGVWYKRGFATQNKIDLSKYSILKVEGLQPTDTTNYNIELDIAIASSLDDANNGASLQYGVAKVTLKPHNTIFEIDISSLAEAQYIVFYGAKGTSSIGVSAQVSKIWLE